MNESPIYRQFGQLENIASNNPDLWDDRFGEISCNLHVSHSFNDTNDEGTTYLGGYMSGDNAKNIQRTFPFENHIPIDGRSITKAYLMDETPLNYFLTQVPQEVTCHYPFIRRPHVCTTCLNLSLHVQVQRLEMEP